MKAVILAAGIASRLRPLTEHTPKCLLKIGEKNLLERIIDAVVANGITEIVLVTGYLQDMIRDFVLLKYPHLKVQFVYNEQYATTNNIYSLWMTKEAVQAEDILLLDSDILFDPRVIASLLQGPYSDCIALNTHELGEEEIKVVVDQDGIVKEISKTCSVNEAIGESIGIEKLSAGFMQSLFQEMDRMILEKGQANVFYELAFENIIRRGTALYVVDTTSFFSMELDTIDDFEHACNQIPSYLL